jgi:predicted enzyme related to lactoylglutathione lyase
MTMEVLFAGLHVADFASAVDWYSRFFDRPPDVVAHDREVMWRVTDGGWLYVLEDPTHAGHGVATISVDDLDQAVDDLRARGIDVQGIEAVGNAAHKAKTHDPDGNEVALIHVNQ